MKKGFTLIELLAVIVILAIIALIATPIVLNIINDAKESAAQRSAEFYLDAVELAIANRMLVSGTISDGNYEIQENGNVCLDKGNNTCNDELVIEVNGKKPTGGLLVYKEKEIVNTTFKYDNNLVGISSGETRVSKVRNFEDGEIVYYDVAKGVGCTEDEYKLSYDSTTSDYSNSYTGYNGFVNYSADGSTSESKLEKQNSCLKFYAFLDDNDYTINLLLDHNTTANVAWISNQAYQELINSIPGSPVNSYPACINPDAVKGPLCSLNKYGPVEVLNVLKSNTDSWNITLGYDDYSFSGTVTGETIKGYTGVTPYEINYNINYSDYKARLLTIEEVEEITNSKVANNSITVTNFGWLYERTGSKKEQEDVTGNWVDVTCYKEGEARKCDPSFRYGNVEMKGYWTGSTVKNNGHVSFAAYYRGNFRTTNLAHPTSGVRPVIEVLKSDIK